MGLASYGDPQKYIKEVRNLISFKSGKLECNMDVFCWNKTDKSMFNEKLAELLSIPQRLPEETLEQTHKDLAAAVQLRYEEVLFEIMKSIKPVSKSSNLTLSGGELKDANGNLIGENGELKIQQDKLKRYLYIALSGIALLGLVVAVVLQRRRIQVQDVEIESQIDSVNDVKITNEKAGLAPIV
jgi:hypothetical protein